MKRILWFSFQIVVLLVMVMTTASCSGTESERSGRDRVREREDSEDVLAEELADSSEEPGTSSPLVALKLQLLHKGDVLDVEGPIFLRAELISPRSFAIQTYNEYRSESEEEIEAPEAVAGSEESPWWEGLRLVHLDETGEQPIGFELTTDQSNARLDLGKGEVGSIEIALSPDVFQQEGEYRLQAILGGSGEEFRSDELAFKLIRGAFAQQDMDINLIRYHLAAKRTGEALKIADAMVEREPENHLSYSYRGRVLEEMGNLEEAVSAYRNALGRYPDEQPGRIYEGPQGLLQRIHRLETDLGRR